MANRANEYLAQRLAQRGFPLGCRRTFGRLQAATFAEKAGQVGVHDFGRVAAGVVLTSLRPGGIVLPGVRVHRPFELRFVVVAARGRMLEQDDLVHQDSQRKEVALPGGDGRPFLFHGMIEFGRHIERMADARRLRLSGRVKIVQVYQRQRCQAHLTVDLLHQQIGCLQVSMHDVAAMQGFHRMRQRNRQYQVFEKAAPDARQVLIQR